MSRNLKVLGLALVAVFALNAVLASGASAANRLTAPEAAYPLTLSGEQKVAAVNEFALPGGRKFKCNKVTFSGTQTRAEATNTTTGWSAMVTPTFSECTAEILGNIDPITMTTNGCTFTLTISTISSATTAKGEVHLECPPGKTIEMHIWENSTKHLENAASLCTYSIGPQTIRGVHYEMSSGGSPNSHTYLTLNTRKEEFGKVAVTRNSGTLTNCGAASQEGEYISENKFEATNGAKEMVEATFIEEA
jgi:hypothetical protein